MEGVNEIPAKLQRIFWTAALVAIFPAMAWGQFVNITDAAGVANAGQYSTNLAWGDYDGDGDVDLYVTNWGAAQQPPPDRLYRNDLDGSVGVVFADVSVDLGLTVASNSTSAAWADFDNDGDLDLYVANDFGRNNLYQNNNGHFTDIAPLAGVEDIATGMSASWGDYNRDGLVDVYISNMFSSAGNRIAYQTRFAPNTTDQTVTYLQRTARGNSLFANAGNGTFHDVSELAGVTMGRWAWGSKFVDLNNDGWQDLVVTNGLVTNDDTGDL